MHNPLKNINHRQPNSTNINKYINFFIIFYINMLPLSSNQSYCYQKKIYWIFYLLHLFIAIKEHFHVRQDKTFRRRFSFVLLLHVNLNMFDLMFGLWVNKGTERLQQTLILKLKINFFVLNSKFWLVTNLQFGRNTYYN